MEKFYNMYFGRIYKDDRQFISGLKLPNPENTPYSFINCDFHPRLNIELLEAYQNCEFIACNIHTDNRK